MRKTLTIKLEAFETVESGNQEESLIAMMGLLTAITAISAYTLDEADERNPGFAAAVFKEARGPKIYDALKEHPKLRQTYLHSLEEIERMVYEKD